jgi:putative endonuclease
MRVKDAVGRYGEDLAADHLAECGMTVLDRNWRCRYGEIDIIARDGEVLAFVEVKTRSGSAFGMPAEAITPVKLARMGRLAAHWLAEHPQPGGWVPVRLDVVSVLRRPAEGGPVVEHLRGVTS